MTELLALFCVVLGLGWRIDHRKQNRVRERLERAVKDYRYLLDNEVDEIWKARHPEKTRRGNGAYRDPDHAVAD